VSIKPGQLHVAPTPIAPGAKAPVAPVAPAAQADVDDDLVDYLVTRELRSLDGWRAFLAAHGSGLHAQSARAEIEKLLHAEKPPAPAAADVSNSVSPDVKTKIEAVPPAGPSAGGEVAPSTPDEICTRDEERLERLRSSPSSDEAARFANGLSCEKLRPQLLRLMETLGSLAPAPAAADVSNSVSPDVKTKIEATPPAGPSAGSEVAPSTPDEICKRDEERLERLRTSPSSEEAARFANELRCEKLRPQLLGLMETLGYAPASASQRPSVTGISALGLKAASDCVSEQDRLDRIRAQPSADTAQQFWRDLQCERLRPQVRLLLESLNIAADPPAACQREAEELNRIRTNPNRREAETLAQGMTCDALKPQAARLLESLAE
jgi:hypothetical protein